MITAVALVCLYANPAQCVALTSKVFYTTEEQCYMDRISAETALNNTLQGVVAYYCHEWGEST